MVRQLARPTGCQAYLLARDLIHRTSELAGVQTVVFSESAGPNTKPKIASHGADRKSPCLTYEGLWRWSSSTRDSDGRPLAVGFRSAPWAATAITAGTGAMSSSFFTCDGDLAGLSWLSELEWALLTVVATDPIN